MMMASDDELDPTQDRDDVTQLVERQRAGDREAADRLLQVLYRDLRALAQSYFGGRHAGHTLQPTALVHEVFIRLVGGSGIHWDGRSHFLAVAAKAMRNVLADHARARRAAKRGGDQQRVTLSGVGGVEDAQAFDASDLHEALERLAGLNQRQAQIVEFRFFGGLTVLETAEVLGVSERTVRGDWRLARAWLRQELGEGEHT